MKKFFIWLLVIIVLILLLLCGLLFTPVGNGILKPYIQKEIDKYSPIPITLNVFELGFSSFHFELSSMSNINISSNGTFSLFSQSIDGILNINIKSLANIKQLEGVNVNLDNNVLIENVIRGYFNDLTINTRSKLAGGKLAISAEIKNFILSNIIANINDVKIDSLLRIAGEKPYASGILNVLANVNSNDNTNFTGKVETTIKDGIISSSLIKKDFDIDTPNTNFIINLISNFNGRSIHHKLDFMSNIGNIKSTGETLIDGFKTSSTYDINIDNLSPLSPLAGIPLKGSFETNGRIVGNSVWLNIDGATNFASSNTAYSISLEKYSKPKDALITIENLKIEDLLKTFVQPAYASGILNAKIDLKNISSAVNGTYTHTISGSLRKNTINQEFDFDLNNDLGFRNTTNAIFTSGIGKINSTTNSDIANVEVSNAILNTNDMSLEAPYDLIIPDLKKIAFVTGKELKGRVDATGLIKYADSNLYANIKSNILGGSFDAKLYKNIIDMNLLNANSMDLLDMLQYPKIFETTINGKVKYDMLTQKGTLNLFANNGHFAQNKLMTLLNSILKFDATKEIYDNITIDGDINKKQVTADLNMNSNNTTISSKNAQIDIDKNTINAYLTLKVKNDELGANITGDINNPNVSLDTKKLATDLIKNVMGNEKVQEQREKIEEKINDTISNGLNKLFKK